MSQLTKAFSLTRKGLSAADGAGGQITFRGFHRTPLEVGQGSFPIVAHAEDQMATRPGALEHV